MTGRRPRSAVSGKRELQSTIEGLVQKNTEFYTGVRETLARFDARRNEAARSTRHGAT